MRDCALFVPPLYLVVGIIHRDFGFVNRFCQVFTLCLQIGQRVGFERSFNVPPLDILCINSNSIGEHGVLFFYIYVSYVRVGRAYLCVV